MKEIMFITAYAGAYERNELFLLTQKNYTDTEELKKALWDLYLRKTGHSGFHAKDFDESWNLYTTNEVCKKFNDIDPLIEEWVFPVTIGTDKPDTFRAVTVYGDNVGKHYQNITAFLRKTKDELRNDFRNCYQAKQVTFRTAEELDAFLTGIQEYYENNDIACFTRPDTVSMILDIFGQKPKKISAPTPKQRLQAIIRSLTDLKESGWIPFSSPSPSSTEHTIKGYVNAALDFLEKADSLEKL